MLRGRDTELRALRGVLDAARAGTGGAAVLRGEPGIGKTALLRALDTHPGLTVLRTRGFEADAALPFAALITLLTPVLGHRETLPEGPRAAMEAALAIAPPRSPDRFATYSGILMLVERAADALGPLLLSVDDAHWLDPSSAEALAYCARRLEDLPVALVAATRIGEGMEPRFPAAHVLELARLPESAAREVVAAADPSLDDRVVDRILRVAEGNPLALREIPGTLTEDEREGRTPLPDPLRLTDAIDAALRRRVERLSDAARRALVVVAAGIDAAAEDIRAVCATLDDGDEAIAEAVAARVLEEAGGRLEFTHPLLRAVVLAGAAPPEVREAHRRLAARSAPDRVGWHLAAAAVGADDQAAAALDVAGQAAAVRTAYATASEAFALGAELTSVPDAKAHRLLQAAGMGQMGGRFPEAFGQLEAAAAVVTDPALAAEIDHLRGMVHTYAGSSPEGVRLLFDSAERVAHHSPVRAAQMLVDSSMAWGMAGEPAMCIVACRRAQQLDVLDEIGRAKLELAAGNSLFFVGRGREVRSRTDAIRQACDTLQPLGRDDHGLICGAIVRMYLGDLDGSDLLLRRCIDACRRHGALGPLAFYLATRADLAFRIGRWADGIAAGDEAFDVAMETGQIPIAGYALCVLAQFDAGMGRRATCTDRLSRAEELIRLANTGALTVWSLRARGLLELGCGHPDAAVEALEGIAQFWEGRGVRCAESVPWEQDLVEAYAACGRVGEARARLRRLAEEAHGSDGAQTHALVARCRGLLDPDHARHFEEALAHHARVPVPFEVARTRLLYGERLRRDRRRGRAEEQLRAALETFERLGATPWAQRTVRELEAVGAVTARGRAPMLSVLTPREIQVAVVVAEGATNAEAAARLFMSEKTVARHLSSVFAKLGLRSRTELAAHLARPAPPGSG